MQIGVVMDISEKSRRILKKLGILEIRVHVIKPDSFFFYYNLIQFF